MAESKFLKWQDANGDMLPDECPTFPPAEDACLPCSPNPLAVVPKWRSRNQHNPFLNEKLCLYQVTFVTSETTTGWVEGMPIEAAEEAIAGIWIRHETDAILALVDFYEKDNSEESIEKVRAAIEHTSYDLAPNPGSRLKLLYSVDYATIANLPDREDEPEEEDEPGDKVVKYDAHDMLISNVRVRKGLLLHSRYLKVYRAIEGGNLKFLKDNRIFNLEDYGDDGIWWSTAQLGEIMNDLDDWLNAKGYNIANTGGFFGFLQDKVTRLQFTFDPEYDLKKLKIWTEACAEKPKIYKKSQLSGLKKGYDSWKDKTAVAYFAQMSEMEADLSSREEPPWIEFLTEYTYPEIYSTKAEVFEEPGERTVSGCIADALADEMKELGQDILDEAFSIGDAIAYAFHKNLCRKDPNEVHAGNIDLGYSFGYTPNDTDPSKAGGGMLMQAYKELDKRDAAFAKFCISMLSFRTTGSPLQMIDSLWAEGFERIKICGLLELCNDAIQCLFKGLTLEEALASMLRAALKSMSLTDFGDLFVGLSPEKRAELDELVKKKIESGDVFAPGSENQRQSDAIKNEERAEGTPFFGNYSVRRPWENPDLVAKQTTTDDSQNNAIATAAPYQDDSEQVERRSLAQKLDKGPAGKDDLDPNLVMDAYILALLETFSDNLLGLLDELNKFPGAQIIAMVLSTMPCPRPALFNPSIADFIKSIGLPFCRNKNEIVAPRLENPFLYIPKLKDILRVIMEILERELIRLIIRIAVLMIVKLCEIIGQAICKALEMAGNIVTSLPDMVTGRTTLANVIKETICGPDADDQTVNDTIVQLVGDLGVGGQALANPERALSFAEDLSASTTRGELINAMLGNPSTTFLQIGHEIVENEYPDYLEALPNQKALGRFFTNIANIMPQQARMEMRMALDMWPESEDLPANPSLCATPEQIEDFEALRCDLLAGRASPDQCKAMFEEYRGTLLEDLDDAANIAQTGFSQMVQEGLPPIFSDPGCDNGLLPFEPEESVATSTGALKGDADKMRLAFSEDMLGNGGLFTTQKNWGFMNMVLSDTMAFPYTAHTRYTFANPAAVDFYLDPGEVPNANNGQPFDWRPDPSSLGSQKGAYPKYVAEWLMFQFKGCMDFSTTFDSLGSFADWLPTGGSDLAAGVDDTGRTSFVFKSTNNIKSATKRRKSFEDLGFVDFLGFTNVDLLGMPDFGYNTKLDVEFNKQKVVIEQLPRKKSPDILLLFRDNAKGLRFGAGDTDGQSTWAYGFKLKAYFSDTHELVNRSRSGLEDETPWPETVEEYEIKSALASDEVTYYANRPDDNIRVYITGMFNESSDIDKTMDNLLPASKDGVKGKTVKTKNDTDTILKWREYEFLAVDDGLDEVDIFEYPSFMEATQRLINDLPPQVNMLYDLFGGAAGKVALKSAYDSFMQKMFTNAATMIAGESSSTDRRAWLYGAVIDDLTSSDFDYMIARSDVDDVDSSRDTAKDATGTDGKQYVMYADAIIYDYDDDGARDGEHNISEDDGILGRTRSQVLDSDSKPARVITLDPNKYGGKYVNPPLYIEPKASAGWKGIVDIMFPDLRPCKPHMTEAVDFQEVKDMIDRVYPRIPSDHRLKHSEDCKVEVPYNRILERSGRAGLMGVIVSLIKTFAATHFLKSLATFTAFAPKFSTNYSNIYPAYIIEVMESSLKEPISFLSPFSNNPFWYAFLEQAVQMYAWRVDDGDIPEEDVPVAVQDALTRLNDLQENYSYPWRDDLLRARDSDDAGEFETLESYRTDKNLEAVKATEEDAKLILAELVKEQLNIVGDTFIRNLEKAGFKPEIYDLDYYFMSHWAAGSTLDLDKKVKQVSLGLPTLDADGPGPHYTNGNEFSLIDGSTYVGYYHIYKYEEEDPFLSIDAGQEVYMVGEQHSEDEHHLLRPFANKQQLAGVDGTPIGGVPAIDTVSATEDQPFLIEKFVEIEGTTYDPALASATIRDLGTGNVSDHYPGDMSLVKDDTGRVVGVDGDLGVMYGLKFSMRAAGATHPITTVKISALDVPVSAFPEALQDNSVLLYCLIEKLKKDPKFKLVTSYIFSFKKVLALMAIYNDMGFLPSIGEVTAGEDELFGIVPLSNPTKWIDSGGTKPGGYATVDFSPSIESWDGESSLTINSTDIEYNRGWAAYSTRTPLMGNPFVLKYDEWDQILLRNSINMARKIFYAHYNSRDFGLADGSDGPSQWLEQLKARFKLQPPNFLPANRKRNLRSNPFNADGNLCDKKN